MRGVQQIPGAPGLFFGASSGAVIEIKKSKVEPDAEPGVGVSSNKWSRWGTENNYPQKLIDANMQDATSAGAMRFKIDAHYGAGLWLYRKEVDGAKEIYIPIDQSKIPAEIDDFFYENDIENFQQGLVGDYEWFQTCYVQYIANKTRNKIGGVAWQRTKNVRAEMRNKRTGAIDNYYLSGNWPDPAAGEYVAVPAFDRRNPLAKPNAIYKHQKVSIDKDYYVTPEWHSNLKWLAVASKIPDWINSNIDNSLNIKYHIEIPAGYFESIVTMRSSESEEEWKSRVAEKKEEVLLKIDDMLAGRENAGKTFYSQIAIDDNGNQIPGWTIHELKNDIKDEAWLRADQTAASRILTAHGVPAPLAGVIIGNTQSGSGSDYREQFNGYVQLKTVIPRQTTTEWFEIVKRANGWDRNLFLGYKNLVLQTLDQNKSGSAMQTEPNPTTSNVSE